LWSRLCWAEGALYHVYKRPIVEFFRAVSGWYTIVMLTAFVQGYVDRVVDWLDVGHSILAYRLFRDVYFYAFGYPRLVNHRRAGIAVLHIFCPSALSAHPTIVIPPSPHLVFSIRCPAQNTTYPCVFLGEHSLGSVVRAFIVYCSYVHHSYTSFLCSVFFMYVPSLLYCLRLRTL